MKSLIEYFKPRKEETFFEEKKTIAFITLIISLLILAIIIAVYFMLISQTNNTEAVLRGAAKLGSFLIINLIIIKYTNIKIAGNIFSLGIVILMVIIMNKFHEELSVLYKFIQGYYLLLAFLGFSALFANRTVLIINSLIILASNTNVLSHALNMVEDTNYIKSAYTFNTVSIIILTITLYFTIKFAEDAIKRSEAKAEESEKKNKLLLNMIDVIEKSSLEIYNASNQLSEISQNISQNSNEQAATVEQVASSMEEILSMVETSTNKAKQTGVISEKAAKEIKESNIIFRQTIDSIAEITKKITIILDIANKTDILSVNAAIEASRSGSNGKGFAVVADEIRKLADKTKSASAEITKLSTQGKEISEEAGTKLSELIPQIIESAELVKQIVSSSSQQLAAMQAITDSVEQLSETSNQNSASAEEMSSSAEELASQAEQLKELVKKTKLSNNQV